MWKQTKTLHEILMAKKGLYAAWHKFSNYQIFNWLLFVLLTTFMTLALLANIRLTLNMIFAQSGVALSRPPKALALTSIKITDITQNSATLVFSTRLDTTAWVSYGPNVGDLTQSVADDKLANTHTVKIAGLKPHAQYFYQVTVLGMNGKDVANSAIASFSTLAK